MQSNSRQAGFTLIEMLVVLVIIGMLAGLVGPRLLGNVDKSKVQTAETQVKMLKSALSTYRLDTGRYPDTSDGLNALLRAPAGQRNWNGPYLDEELPVDPWGNPYQYRNEKSGLQDFVLYSFGADGKAGGQDFDADVGYLPEKSQ